MTTRDLTWLNQVEETPLEPERPIVDAHHHLWDHQGDRYLLDEIMRDISSGHNIVKTVFVDCMAMYRADGPEAFRPVGEVEFINGVAAQSASGQYGNTRVAAGIVGFADLFLGGAVSDVLRAQIAAAPGRFRGIRHAAGWDADKRIRNSHTNPSQGLLLDKTFRTGFACLAPLNLTFDAWMFHPQTPELTNLARAFPETTIILNHFGGPLGIGPYEGKKDEIFSQWKHDIAEVATCPNVVAKLGGINMGINGFDWSKHKLPPTSDQLVDSTRDYYLHTIDVFGPERCMFESNFPVDKYSCSYGVLWNAFKKIAGDFSVEEKAALFHDTATRVYRL